MRKKDTRHTQYEDDFIQRAAERSQQERDKALAQKKAVLAQKKAVLAQSEKRIAELDVIFKRIYEDNISGKLSDDRFIKLSRDYEQEQEQLKAVVETLKKQSFCRIALSLKTNYQFARSFKKSSTSSCVTSPLATASSAV